jgi:hypothetical protein
MKRLLLCLIVALAFAGTLRAQGKDKDKDQDQERAQDPVMKDSDKFFLPKDTLWGYAQFDLAPPHNEIDPNLCASNAGTYGGVNAPCSLFARYMLSGLLEVRPFGKGQLRRFMVWGQPSFLFGKTIPQTLYTWSPDAIGIEHSWGVAIYIAKGFDVRFTQHFLFDRLGARDTNLGAADLGNNGPWGRYNTIGVRKTFGTRRW